MICDGAAELADGRKTPTQMSGSLRKPGRRALPHLSTILRTNAFPMEEGHDEEKLIQFSIIVALHTSWQSCDL